MVFPFWSDVATAIAVARFLKYSSTRSARYPRSMSAVIILCKHGISSFLGSSVHSLVHVVIRCRDTGFSWLSCSIAVMSA